MRTHAFIASLALALTAAPVMAHPATVGAPRSSAITGPSPYIISVFARGTGGNSKPDAIVAHGQSLYVAFQDDSTPTGGGHSTIVEYDRLGHALRSVALPGRCDGMRYNPYGNQLWATVNEDANSSLYVWSLSNNSVKHYTFSSAAHGGGYDDLAFTNGQAFIAASNPTLNAQGINTGPAVVSVTLEGSVARVTPVLFGNASSFDVTSRRNAALNLTDPDSMTVDPAGDLVLIGQGDQQIVVVRGAGRAGQRVANVHVNTQLDDTVWATDSSGVLLVADSAANAIYAIAGQFVPGTIYTETPGDSTVTPGVVGVVDPRTGTVMPVFTGFMSPTGLLFVPLRGAP